MINMEMVFNRLGLKGAYDVLNNDRDLFRIVIIITVGNVFHVCGLPSVKGGLAIGVLYGLVVASFVTRPYEPDSNWFTMGRIIGSFIMGLGIWHFLDWVMY